MNTKALRQKMLDLAIRGKLVPQDPNDEPASVLLDKIRAEKQQNGEGRKAESERHKRMTQLSIKMRIICIMRNFKMEQ